MPHTLSKPGTGSGFRAADHVGELVVFIGCSLEVDVQTTFGLSNAARVQITVPLDGDNAGEVYHDSLLFQKVLVSNLVGDDVDSPIVAGRLGTGEAKPGQSAPYVLSTPTDDEIKAIETWLDENITEDGAGRYRVTDTDAA